MGEDIDKLLKALGVPNDSAPPGAPPKSGMVWDSQKRRWKNVESQIAKVPKPKDSSVEENLRYHDKMSRIMKPND